MIGKIKRIPLREVWKHEALDFTKWLEGNLDVLSEAIGATLSNAEREKDAGEFSVDLVAEHEGPLSMPRWWMRWCGWKRLSRRASRHSRSERSSRNPIMTRTPAELQQVLDRLLRLPQETEWLEFKEAKASFSFEKLGEYFSALSNEANLNHQPAAWLLFGVRQRGLEREIVGSQFRINRADLEGLKSEVASHTTGRVTFIDRKGAKRNAVWVLRDPQTNKT
ncbi:MAG: ATP-binding protein [Armatimonadetes bacterium]|nr:ATP-binding protein [Armatimonadota bacterium]